MKICKTLYLSAEEWKKYSHSATYCEADIVIVQRNKHATEIVKNRFGPISAPFPEIKVEFKATEEQAKKNADDLKYLQRKLFSALNIPKEHLGYEPEKPIQGKNILSISELQTSLGSGQEYKIKILPCQCGAEKANTTHSDWCPKHA